MMSSLSPLRGPFVLRIMRAVIASCRSCNRQGIHLNYTLISEYPGRGCAWSSASKHKMNSFRFLASARCRASWAGCTVERPP